MNNQNKSWRKDIRNKFVCKENIVICTYDDLIKLIEDEILKLNKKT